MPSVTPPPADRFCDLVMKGGITSGVVYPRAISKLSHHYHFKSIGGTSAGAIAAAVTAAAEYQRLQTGSRAGFDLLETLPELLKENVAPNRSKLMSLFQPQPRTRRLFNVLEDSLNRTGTYRRITCTIAGFLKSYWLATLVSFALAMLALVTGQGILAAALTLLVATIVTVGLWVWHDLRRVVDNGFGLCSGLSEDKQQPALTPWLHELIQHAAGRSVHDAPLTFGDLWCGKKYEPGKTSSCKKEDYAIDLQMFSTNLSHGRPYVFPLDDEETGPTRFRYQDRLFFKPDEISRIMPPDIVHWIMKYSRPYELEPGRKDKDPPTIDGAGLRSLPRSADLPVLLATRMSLSFPLLFSAVPLYAINHELPKGCRKFARCWFSDGGISSNFPMHLFDDLVPAWPTFGISLEPRIDCREDIFLPQHYKAGYGERWDLFGDGTKKPASQLGGFFAAIIKTMQNWNDNSLARMPGIRDRVVRLRLDPDEGGMNLNMEPDLIDRIAERGERASDKLVERFVAATPDGPQAKGWDEHRFVRLNTLLKMINAQAPGVANALSPNCPHATDLESLLSFYSESSNAGDMQRLPPGFEGPLSPELHDTLIKAVEALASLSEEIQKTDSLQFTPVPSPVLRVRPPL